MTNLVLMTALPPTEGHLALCRFAARHALMAGGDVLVLVCVLPDEPPGRGEHRDALAEALRDCTNVRVEIQFSNDPQGPRDENDDEFWAHWVRVVTRQSGKRITRVYSSEAYGYRLAESLGAEHVPYSPGREVSGVSATSVRGDIVGNFGKIIRPLRDRLRRRVVLFGPESTGKSTLGRLLAQHFSSVYAPEWARPYLEGLPTPETTSDRMDEIVLGQHAHENAAWLMAEDRGCPFVFYDTDLLSTIGFDQYFSSFGRFDRDDQWKRRARLLEDLFKPADLYLLCAPTIPLETDPLRYASGGSLAERETSLAFWENILKARDLNYRVVKEKSRSDRLVEGVSFCLEELQNRAGFCGYERRR